LQTPSLCQLARCHDNALAAHHEVFGDACADIAEADDCRFIAKSFLDRLQNVSAVDGKDPALLRGLR